jgi:hypothetical protein
VTTLNPNLFVALKHPLRLNWRKQAEVFCSGQAGSMEYLLDNRVVLSAEREHKSLYPWSIKEFDENGKQIGRDQIPWDWSLRFEIIELVPTCTIQIKGADADQAEASKAELSEYIYGKIRPSVDSREAGLYSMFGTQRTISEFGLFIYKATNDESRCNLWGSVSYTSDNDFEDVTEADAVVVYVHLSREKFDQLMKFVKFPRPTGAEIRLKGVSGFYSDWSPSIRTDSIKILANAGDQRLENPQRLDIKTPVLGRVEEFDLVLRQRYPINAK